jgi:uncharacterized LabA/DUF88 family protein
MKKLVLMLDGEHIGSMARRERLPYGPDLIEAFARNCAFPDEELFRVLYYDCAPYVGQHALPVSGSIQIFSQSGYWFKELAKKEPITVKLGAMKFCGFKLKRSPLAGMANLTDADFRPDFEKKGITLQIGLDIAAYSALESIDRMAFVTADPDYVPAMKFARRSGLEVILIRLPVEATPGELMEHADSVRTIEWP